MTESKPTRGHYTFVHQFNVECDRRGIANCGGYSPSHGQQEAFEENKANALLVADAFNVYNETGLTPRQLAEQRDDLFNMLGYLIDACDTADISAIDKRVNVIRSRFAVIRDSVRSRIKGAANV